MAVLTVTPMTNDRQALHGGPPGPPGPKNPAGAFNIVNFIDSANFIAKVGGVPTYNAAFFGTPPTPQAS